MGNHSKTLEAARLEDPESQIGTKLALDIKNKSKSNKEQEVCRPRAIKARYHDGLEATREFVQQAVGVFTLTDACMWLDTQDRKAVSTNLSKLAKEGVVEKGSRYGTWRALDYTEEVIDFINAGDEVTAPFLWFLDCLNGRFEVTPGSVIVISGETNAGKSAACLNLILQNQDHWDTYYFASSAENNARTLKKRLSSFTCALDSWKFTPIRKDGGFADVIRPDGLNIIDYLELTGEAGAEFFMVGAEIKRIHEKLRDGLAVIAIQHNPGRALPMGGALGLHKAAVALSLHAPDPETGTQLLRVMKAKYPLVDYATRDERFRITDGGTRFVSAKYSAVNTGVIPF